MDLISPMLHALDKIEAPPPEPKPTKCGTPCQDFQDAVCEPCESPVKGKDCSSWSECTRGDPGDWAREVVCGGCDWKEVPHGKGLPL